jgi:RNA polymerase-binding protein DksA
MPIRYAARRPNLHLTPRSMGSMPYCQRREGCAAGAPGSAAYERQRGPSAMTPASRRTASTPVKSAARKSAATTGRKPAATSAAKTPAKTAAKAPAKTTVKAPAKTAAKAPAKAASAAKTATAARTGTKAPVTKAAPAKVTSRTATKVATTPELAVREGDTAWTAAEIKAIQATIEADMQVLREEIALAQAEVAGLMRQSGDGAGDDQADAGSKTLEREQEMSLANNAREMLDQDQHALDRIADGTYGICESCGNPIGKLRLEAAPRATLCVPCKTKQERR